MNSIVAPSIKTLADIIGTAVLSADLSSLEITGIQTDSNLIKKGNLFVALQGDQHNGLNYVSDVVNRGAVAILTDSDNIDFKSNNSCRQTVSAPVLSIPKLKEKLGEIVASFYDRPSERLTVFGVTGTNGKSSCVHIMASVIQAMGRCCGVIGTLGYGLFSEEINASHTTPDVIRVHKLLFDMERNGASMIAMEVSSHGLSQGRVDAVKFDTAIFTNLTRDHLDYHGDMECYGKEKLKLFLREELKYGVVNLDDPFSDEIIPALSSAVKLIRYSVNNNLADVYVDQIAYHPRGIRAMIVYADQSAELDCPLLGEFNLSNVLAVISALLIHGYNFNELVKAIKSVSFVPGRLQLIGDDHAAVAIVDYAHTPDALEKALLAVKKHFTGKIWCVFGCGGDRDVGKRSMMAKVAELLADKIVITSDNPRTESPHKIITDIYHGIKNNKKVVIKPKRSNAIDYALQVAEKDDVVLVAGKGHEDYQEINGERKYFSDIEYINHQLSRQNEESPYD